MQWPAFLCVLVLSSLGSNVALAQDDPVIAAIQREARERSAAYGYAFQLTDVVGARLSGSPAFRRAAAWAQKALTNAGIQEARLVSIASEKWAEPGWSYRRFGVRLVEPSFDTLPAIPAPYSPSTGGRPTGEPVFFLLPGRSGLSVDQIAAKFHGQLKGKILMVHDSEIPVSNTMPAGPARLTDDELKALRNQPPHDKPSPQAEAGSERQVRERAQLEKLFAFLRDEGALAFLAPTRGTGGTMMATGSLGTPGMQPPPPPGFNLPGESYNRIVRLMKRGVPVRIEVELESEFQEGGHTNVIADLPGQGMREEVVIVNAHLDSWHVGTGATDNAANCAVLMEAMRILKAVNAPLKRTVRVALWAGHERGVQGSLAYLRKAKAVPSESHYLSLTMDGGAGRVRGLQIQGRKEWIAMADGWLAPFAASSQNWVSMRKSLGSDQYSFEQFGLDNMTFLQDPAWNGRTYHSNMDVLDYVSEQDLKDSAAVVATVLYRAANQ